MLLLLQGPEPESGLLASLGWIDLTALAILVVFFVLGLFHGLVWQISRILTLVLAYVAAGAYGGVVAERIEGWFSEGVAPELPLYVSYFFVFLIVLIVVSVIAYFVEKLVEKSGMSFYNRLGGGVLGVVTGGCVVLAMLAVVLMFFGPDDGIVQAARGSRSMDVSKRVLATIGEVVPEEVRQAFGVELGGAAGEGAGGAPDAGQDEGK